MVDRISERIKKYVKWFGESFFRAVKGLIILEIRLELGTVMCLI